MAEIHLRHYASNSENIRIEVIMMRSEHTLWRSVPPCWDIGRMRSSFNRQILASSKIDNLDAQGVFIDHYIVWFEISVQYSELFVQVFHSKQYLPRYYFYFVGLIQSTFASFKSFFDKLSEIHVHRLEENIQFTIIKVDVVRFHHIRTMCTSFSSFYFVKPL